MVNGWYKESHRHSLAARGITTKRYNKSYFAFKTKDQQEVDSRMDIMRKRMEDEEKEQLECDSCGATVKKRGYKGNFECEKCFPGKLREPPERDMMGFPKLKDVKIMDLDKAVQDMNPQKEFNIKYTINDEQGMPQTRFEKVIAKDSWDAKVKLVNGKKDAYNLHIE